MTIDMTTRIPAVHRTIVVNVAQERAFQVFTAQMGTWWPAPHHIGATPFETVVIEPKVGGRWFERDATGAECEWGNVLTWDPPRRVALSWHLNGEWQWVADPAQASEVEIRFIAESPTSTRVELEHRGFERHGPTAERLREGVEHPEGWTMTLERFAAALAA
jgi:activator of Hsp90 ATPase-like protein